MIVEHTEPRVRFKVMYDREGTHIFNDTHLDFSLTWEDLEKIYQDGKTFLAERAVILAAVQD